MKKYTIELPISLENSLSQFPKIEGTIKILFHHDCDTKMITLKTNTNDFDEI